MRFGCVRPEFDSRHSDQFEKERFCYILKPRQGPVVKWYYAAFALPSRESDSRQVHKIKERSDYNFVGCRISYAAPHKN